MAYPVLYASIVPGTVPTDLGLGVLSPISCYVEESRNGMYELKMVYPANGLHASEIATRRLIKAKPNFTDDPQLFRIYKVGKTLNGQFSVYARHISYGLDDLTIVSGTADNIVAACLLLQTAAPGYTFSTDKSGSGTFEITEPSPVRSWLAGKKGSLLDVYGTGEYYFNNFNVQLKLHRGVTTPRTTIRYGKNLMQLSQELSSENLATSIQAYYKSTDGDLIVGNEISTGLTLDAPVKKLIDCSQDFEETPSVADLDAAATAYISGHELTVPTNNITLDFAQIDSLTERVDLCDMVNIYYAAYGITATAKCIRTKWDVLQERYVETEFGDAKTTLSDLLDNNEAIADAEATAASALAVANSKKRVFTTTPVPPYDVNDIWINEEKIFYCNTAKKTGQVFSEDDWSEVDTVDSTAMADAISHASALITGNAGGYVILHDADGDGSPDELLVVNYPDIDDVRCNRVWRWNLGGLGFANSYASDDYRTALTADGRINADMITTGTLNASLAKIINLSATMFTGSTITLGGYEDQDGKMLIKNSQNVTIGTIDTNGMEFFGETVGGVTPSVVFDKNGMTGYSDKDHKDISAIFWTKKNEFHMKNAVVENEASFGGKIRLVPLQNSTNNGIAIVKAV